MTWKQPLGPVEVARAGLDGSLDVAAYVKGFKEHEYSDLAQVVSLNLLPRMTLLSAPHRWRSMKFIG